MASKKSVLDMIKAEHKENIQKSNETKTIVIKLNIEDFEKSMEGIVARVNKDTLDESPMVYKNIFEVMEMQKELVDVVCHLKPLINIKG